MIFLRLSLSESLPLLACKQVRHAGSKIDSLSVIAFFDMQIYEIKKIFKGIFMRFVNFNDSLLIYYSSFLRGWLIV